MNNLKKLDFAITLLNFLLFFLCFTIGYFTKSFEYSKDYFYFNCMILFFILLIYIAFMSDRLIGKYFWESRK